VGESQGLIFWSAENILRIIIIMIIIKHDCYKNYFTFGDLLNKTPTNFGN
jgi:hypothetical protein